MAPAGMKKDQSMAASKGPQGKSEEGLWETTKVIIQALLIAFVVRTFIYQPFNMLTACFHASDAMAVFTASSMIS